MSTKPVNIYWGDGYIRIEPALPEALTKALRYWHRTLEYDQANHKRAVMGYYKELYNLGQYIDGQQQIIQTMTTMPGFMSRIKKTLTAAGVPFNVIDERTPFPAPNIEAACAHLRPYQWECAYTALVSGGGQIACPTGWGKTHVIAALIKAFPVEELKLRNTPLVVVAAVEKDINAQNFSALQRLLPDRDVGIVMSGAYRPSDDVNVVTMESLHKVPLADAGIFIADEVHMAATDRRAEFILMAKKALRWGTSATPSGRFDGGDLMTEGLFGPVIYRRTYADGIADGALVPITVYWVRAPEPHIGLPKYELYKSRQGKYTHGVERNANLNDAIAELMSAIPDTMQTLCIMPRLLQMDDIKGRLPAVVYVHGETSSDNIVKNKYFNLAPVTNKERRTVYDHFASGKLRKVLSTYVYKQGVNFPELSVLICAGGGGSQIAAGQIPGRASRNVPGKDEAYMVDFWHTWDTYIDETYNKSRPGPILRDDQERDKVYANLGFKRVWVDSVKQLPFYGATHKTAEHGTGTATRQGSTS